MVRPLSSILRPQNQSWILISNPKGIMFNEQNDPACLLHTCQQEIQEKRKGGGQGEVGRLLGVGYIHEALCRYAVKTEGRA